MDTTFFDSLRPFLSRVIAAGLAAGIGFIATKLGIDIDSAHATELATSVGTFLALAVFGIAHKLLDKKLNPGDAASKHMAVVEKEQTAALKSGQDNTLITRSN
jgi:hypothetical protein